MFKSLRLAAVVLALALPIGAVVGCDFLGKAAQVAGEVKGNIGGTVKDADGKAISGATVRIYGNKELTGTGAVDGSTGVVNLDKLKNSTGGKSTPSDSGGNWKFEGLKVLDGPYVLIATNARGQDFRGIDRDNKKLFSVEITDPSKPPAFSANAALFPDPTKAVAVAFVLPAETPPEPKAADAAPAPEPIPTPVPTPTPAVTPTAPPVGSADDVANKSKLPPPNPSPAAGKKLESFKVYKADGGAELKTPSTGAGGFLLYELADADISGSNKVLLTAKATGLTAATLLVSYYIEGKGDAKISEQAVTFGSDGNLVTAGGSTKGYTFAVPRDKGKTVLQLVDRASGAISNAVAIDGSKLSDSVSRPFTVIMSWDKGGGTDIDLHTFDVKKTQIAWFGDLDIDNGSLDLDNTEGYGPETFTGKPSKYGISINYWYGSAETTVKVRVIYSDGTNIQDKTFQRKMKDIGEWWDVGVFDAK